MHLLVLQHESVEHSGIFRKFLSEDGHSWDVVELDEGGQLPSLDDYDGLWVLGGPMDVWQEDEFPWLAAEKSFIKRAVEELGMPYLGLCLGHQLLAEALGGTVGKSATPEVGICDVQLTEAGATGVILDGLPEQFPCLQWHSAEITKMPPGGAMPCHFSGLRSAGDELGPAGLFASISRGNRNRHRGELVGYSGICHGA